jgi:hypothetical protein
LDPSCLICIVGATSIIKMVAAFCAIRVLVQCNCDQKKTKSCGLLNPVMLITGLGGRGFNKLTMNYPSLTTRTAKVYFFFFGRL